MLVESVRLLCSRGSNCHHNSANAVLVAEVGLTLKLSWLIVQVCAPWLASYPGSPSFSVLQFSCA